MPLEFILKPHKTGLSVCLVCMYIVCIYRYVIMFALTESAYAYMYVHMYIIFIHVVMYV